MEIMRTEHLTRVFSAADNQVIAVNDVDLTVARGEFIAVIGASGSGKSTLMHLLGAVDRPTSGRIFLEDTDITTYSQREMALFRRRKVGLIYQFYNLIPNMTVAHNILLPLKLDRKAVDERYYRTLVDRLGLADKLNRFPGQLSGGQEQRVAIARALIYKPSIILADEPTGNLDRENSKEIIDLLKLSNLSDKQTIIMITHDESLALEADRIIAMQDGRIVGDDNNETAR